MMLSIGVTGDINAPIAIVYHDGYVKISTDLARLFGEQLISLAETFENHIKEDKA